MKKILSFLALALSLCVFTACDDNEVPANGYIETTETGASTTVLKGYTSYSEGFSVLQPAGFTKPLYLKNGKLAGNAYDYILTTSNRLDAMGEVPVNGDWTDEAAVMNNTCYWVRYAGDAYHYIKMRIAYIDGNNLGIEYRVSDTVTPRPNANANNGSTNKWAQNLEMPHFNAEYELATHEVTYNGTTYMNLAIEWNGELRHANWVAYSFDKTTSQSNVSRSNAWGWDPDLKTGTVEEANHKSDGFDKGHLCASSDRLYCLEANEQTFYYSNMSPMINQFNTGYWGSIETIVKKWAAGTQNGTFDNVYVVKGGTLNQLKTSWTCTKKGNDGVYPYTDANGLSKGGLAVPAYYFVAILAEKDAKYQAIGFLVEHREDLSTSPTLAMITGNLISIDKLEEMTGIDFFCNLSDDTEKEVEANYDITAWDFN